MSIELRMEGSFMIGKKKERQLLIEFMEEYDDRFKRLWI